MQVYTNDELKMGLGAFEQAMRSQSAVLRFGGRVTPGVAVGVLASMMRSGLTANKIDELIENGFTASAPLLKQVLALYEGNSWDIHLWNLLATGQYKVCTALCQPCQPTWRYDRSGSSDW